jgi:hypothetical protein
VVAPRPEGVRKGRENSKAIRRGRARRRNLEGVGRERRSGRRSIVGGGGCGCGTGGRWWCGVGTSLGGCFQDSERWIVLLDVSCYTKLSRTVAYSRCQDCDDVNGSGSIRGELR